VKAVGGSVCRFAQISAAVIICVLIAPRSTALASGGYSFDAQRSLTGSCTTSKVDAVPDPGCPSGNHPPNAFASPRSVVTDFYGNIFVASWGEESAEGAEGRIDIFNADGLYLTGMVDQRGPRNLAVDSEGNLYVFEQRPGFGGRVVRYRPTVYDPAAGEIEYAGTPILIESIPWFLAGMAINPFNDRLFVHRMNWIAEFGSAEEGNVLLDKIGEGVISGDGQGLAVDALGGRLYASDEIASGEGVIDVFDLGPDHAALEPIDGSETPPGNFSNRITFAIDESTGNILVYDGERVDAVYQLTHGGSYVSAIEHDFAYAPGAEIGVDNGPFSPNNGYLFVPSHPNGTGHSFAFGPPPPTFPPEIKSLAFSGISEDDGQLQAVVQTGGLETTYRFEYTTQQSFEAESFAAATLAMEGQIPGGEAPVPISAVAENLEPDTRYRFRLLVTNLDGFDEAEKIFATYPAESIKSGCSNATLRTGLSMFLPDCRAYELVTPTDTNGRVPLGVGYLGTYFATRHTSPSGGMVSFQIEGGAIPGYEATGSYAGDPYLSTRTDRGWETTYAGPNGEESPALLPGSNSPDQSFSFWSTGSGQGSASVEENVTTYLQYPDGHSAFVGRGSLGVDPVADGKLISEGGTHVIFVSSNRAGKSAVRLEPAAPSNGTQTVYDRTIDPITDVEETHVVSLLPGNKTPAAGQDAEYVGASLDGKGVAFQIGGTLYFRFSNEETFNIGEGLTFAGIAEGGERIFYIKGGDLFTFTAKSQSTTKITETGDVIPVNISADGTGVYWVSASRIPVEPNPAGDLPEVGKQNLYLSDAGEISFVGTVTKRDVEGEDGGNGRLGGLGLWTTAVGPGAAENPGRLAIDPSRSTPDGTVLLFESRAVLDDYDHEGYAQIYRYDSVQQELDCLSCNPTLAPAIENSSLQSIAREQGAPEPFGSFAFVANLRSDGKRAVFQSTEALVASDTDGLQDVYEWEDQGVGSCRRAAGCVHLISSGQSDRIDYLYAVSDSGDDVFFRSSDLLLSGDADETPSIYDARAGGGFPEPGPPPQCQQDCKPPPLPPPMLPSALPPEFGKAENAVRRKRCPKGKRKMFRNGKHRCVRKHKRPRREAVRQGFGASR